MELLRWFLRSIRFFVPYTVVLVVSVVVAHFVLDPITDLDETWTWIVAYYAGVAVTTGGSLVVLLRGRV